MSTKSKNAFIPASIACAVTIEKQETPSGRSLTEVFALGEIYLSEMRVLYARIRPVNATK